MCCRERELPGHGWPQSVQARAAQRCLCPQGMAGGFAWRLRKLYWPCWLVQRSSGGCPGSPPAAGELIYHLPLRVHAAVSEPNCRSSCPLPIPSHLPQLTPGRAGQSRCAMATEWRPLVLLSMPLGRSQPGSGSKSPQSSRFRCCESCSSAACRTHAHTGQGSPAFGLQECWLVESLAWGKGARARGCASSRVSNSCAHLPALARGSRGLPQDPRAHTQGCTLPCHKLTLRSSPGTPACKSARGSHPQQEVVTWTICRDTGHEAATCAGVPWGWAL